MQNRMTQAAAPAIHATPKSGTIGISQPRADELNVLQQSGTQLYLKFKLAS
jgi:hypothetical protein